MRIINKVLGNSKVAAARFYLNGLANFSERRAGKQTIRLFGSPRKGWLTETDTDYLKTATWETLTLGNDKIQTYHWQGTGKRVLLAHGWESNSARWQPLIVLLQAANFDIVSMDAPRHGATGGRFFNAFLYGEMMDVVVTRFKPEVVIGHSIGGFSATYYLHHFEKQKKDPSVSSLILLACPSNMRHIFEMFLDIVGVSPKVKRGYFNEFTRIAGFTVDELTAEIFCKDSPIKTLMVHDSTDEVSPLRDAYKIRDALTNVQFVETHEYGHRMQHSFVYQQVMAFLG
jgi:predicted alpha/beta hydrolase family esterase